MSTCWAFGLILTENLLRGMIFLRTALVTTKNFMIPTGRMKFTKIPLPWIILYQPAVHGKTYLTVLAWVIPIKVVLFKLLVFKEPH